MPEETSLFGPPDNERTSKEGLAIMDEIIAVVKPIIAWHAIEHRITEIELLAISGITLACAEMILERNLAARQRINS